MLTGFFRCLGWCRTPWSALFGPVFGLYVILVCRVVTCLHYIVACSRVFFSEDAHWPRYCTLDYVIMKCQPNLLRREPCHIWQLTMNTSDCACWVAYRNWSYPFLMGTLQLTYSHGFFFPPIKKVPNKPRFADVPNTSGGQIGERTFIRKCWMARWVLRVFTKLVFHESVELPEWFKANRIG